jgi:predicted small secreted protein
MGFTGTCVSFTHGCGTALAIHQERLTMKRLIALMLMAMFSTATLTACNTMAGAGKDVQKVGEKVQDKAEDCKDGKC